MGIISSFFKTNKNDSLNNDVPVRVKAGGIPYFIEKDRTVSVRLMVPSNPKFGGTQPQIAKGNVEHNINSAFVNKDVALWFSAFKEMNEEVGLPYDNIEDYWYYSKLQNIHVFGVKVRSKTMFVKPHYESAYALWLTKEEVSAMARDWQRKFILRFINHVHSREGL